MERGVEECMWCGESVWRERDGGTVYGKVRSGWGGSTNHCAHIKREECNT